MKSSQFVAKVVVRLFLFLLLLSTIPFIQGDNAKLQQFNFVIHQKWTLIFPAILISGFLAFFVSCTVNKYKNPEMNWLLVVNTLVLIAYLVAVFIRVYQQVK